jgi:hypothetical protein
VGGDQAVGGGSSPIAMAATAALTFFYFLNFGYL